MPSKIDLLFYLLPLIHWSGSLSLSLNYMLLFINTGRVLLQDKAAFIFCVEDRALFCQDCDESIHSGNTLSANHQRFLATGIRVALSSACNNKDAQTCSLDPPNQTTSHLVSTKLPNSLFSPPWAVDDLLQLSDFESSDKVRILFRTS